MTNHIIRRVDHFAGAGGPYWTTITAYCDWYYTFQDDCRDQQEPEKTNKDHKYWFFNENSEESIDCDECMEGHGLVVLAGVP